MQWPKQKQETKRSESTGIWQLTEGGAQLGQTRTEWEYLFLGLGLGVFGQFLSQFIWEARITTTPAINWIFTSRELLANTSIWQFIWAMIALVLVWRFQQKFVRIISKRK